MTTNETEGLRVLYVGAFGSDNEAEKYCQLEAMKIQGRCELYKPDVDFQKLLNPDAVVFLKKVQSFKPHILHIGMHGDASGKSYLFPDSEGGLRPLTKEGIAAFIEKSGVELELMILLSCYGREAAVELSDLPRVKCAMGFIEEVEVSNIPSFVEMLYEQLLSGRNVQDSVSLANHSVNEAAQLFWNSELFEHQSNRKLFAVAKAVQDDLQKGDVVEGRRLERFCGEDDLGSVWKVAGAEKENIYRRFLRTPVSEGARNVIENLLIQVGQWSETEPYVLAYTEAGFNCPHPWVEYRHPHPIVWRTLGQLIEEVKGEGESSGYPLRDQHAFRGVLSIVYQLAKSLNEAHLSESQLTHGRLSLESVVVIDRQQEKTSAFSSLRPLITDFGLSMLTSSTHRAMSQFLSPSVRQGRVPTEFDDVFSVCAIWFSLMTGQKPSLEEVTMESGRDWFRPLNLAGREIVGAYDIVPFIQDVYRIAFSGPQREPAFRMVQVLELIGRLLPEEDRLFDSVGNAVETEVNCLGMRFSQVKAERYSVGSAVDEPGRKGDESPQRKVKLGEYWISQRVVSYRDLINLRRIVENHLNEIKERVERRRLESDPAGASQPEEKPEDDHLYFLEATKGIESAISDGERDLPATKYFVTGVGRKISWQFAKLVCSALTKLPNELAQGRDYYLPTESEWEVACRAGTTGMFTNAMTALSDRIANFGGRNSGLVDAGALDPNRWMLHNMHGNVFEYCEDYYDEKIEVGNVDNPKGAQPPRNTAMRAFTRFFGARSRKVIRGGDFTTDMLKCRCASRAFVEDSNLSTDELHVPGDDQHVGIRLVFK